MSEPITSTVLLVQRAFPNGLPDEALLPVLRVLYDHMSHRQLARVVEALVGIEAPSALNEIYEAALLEEGSPKIASAKARLCEAGLSAWIEA